MFLSHIYDILYHTYIQFIKTRNADALVFRACEILLLLSLSLSHFSSATNPLGGFHHPRGNGFPWETFKLKSDLPLWDIRISPRRPKLFFLREKSWLAATAAPRGFIRLKLHEPILKVHTYYIHIIAKIIKIMIK